MTSFFKNLKINDTLEPGGILNCNKKIKKKMNLKLPAKNEKTKIDA